MNARGSFTLVAETGRSPKIAGFIVGRVHPRGLGHIITIDAVATYRRCGLGTLLMTAAEDRLKASGCDAIFLEAAVNNLTALAFYKKLDYYILKTLPRYYNKEMDAFLLVKRLAKAR
jgi:peptide alpha-N-acetyltransferase/N-terminal acetyltransferase B complex catalytic subunit